jgi:hypothetical protein
MHDHFPNISIYLHGLALCARTKPCSYIKKKRLGSSVFSQFSAVSVVSCKNVVICYTFYWLSNNDQTEYGDETESLEREGMKELYFV